MTNKSHSYEVTLKSHAIFKEREDYSFNKGIRGVNIMVKSWKITKKVLVVDNKFQTSKICISR